MLSYFCILIGKHNLRIVGIRESIRAASSIPFFRVPFYLRIYAQMISFSFMDLFLSVFAREGFNKIGGGGGERRGGKGFYGECEESVKGGG